MKLFKMHGKHKKKEVYEIAKKELHKTAKKKELERHANSLVLLEATDEKLSPGGIDPPTSCADWAESQNVKPFPKLWKWK